MKKIIKYVIIFVCTLMILFSALVASSKIPHSAIEENLIKSADFYSNKSGLQRMKKNHVYAFIHYYADTRKLNIINYIDSEKPIESTLWSKYYQEIKADTNKDFINAVREGREPNTNYLRYWNGCMLFIRPLLTTFNIEQIYLINKILLSILSLALLVVLYKKSKKLMIIFIASLILTATWYASMCIEYSVMFYVTFIASIIAIKIDNNKKGKSEDTVNKKLFNLFLITGIMTTFFDFLTTELLTIFVPVIFVLLIRKEENRLRSIKDTQLFVIKSCVLWFAGYCGMWVAKWILSSLILHIDAMEYVKDDFVQRVNGLQGLGNHKILYSGVIGRNFFAIPVFDFLKRNINNWYIRIILIAFLFLFFISFNWKRLKKEKILWILIAIGIMPYIRYFILANHSYRHAMFTFREQIITIIVYLYLFIDCFTTKLLLKKVKIKNDKSISNKKNEAKELIKIENKKISVVIPAYNEEKGIKKTISEIKIVMKENRLSKESEIIVVNDCSTDNTRNEVEKLGVVVIDNPQNMGYGYSLKKGINNAKNETIIITDADNTYPFNKVPEMLKEKEQGYDLVVGARTGENYRESLIKSILRKMLKLFVEFISGKKIKDINSGLRVFDKSTVMKYFPRLCNTFSFTTSQSLAYLMNNLTVKYIDIQYKKRKGESKVKIVRDSLKSMRYILEAGIYYNPLKVFTLLTIICIVLSVIGFIVSHFARINAGYILGIGGLLVSILVFSLGILATLLKQIMDK